MTRLTRRLGGLIKLLALLGFLSYASAAVVTVADILGRRIGLPVEGVVDLVQVFVICGTWMVMPYAFRAGAHVSVDFFIALMPRPLVVLARVAGAVLAAGLLALMLHYGYATLELRMMFGDRSQQLGIPIVWYWVPLLCGLAISVLAVLLALAESFRQDAHKELRR